MDNVVEVAALYPMIVEWDNFAVQVGVLNFKLICFLLFAVSNYLYIYEC